MQKETNNTGIYSEIFFAERQRCPLRKGFPDEHKAEPKNICGRKSGLLGCRLFLLKELDHL